MIVLDACVLAAFADPEHQHHQSARSIMARTDPFVISALTGAEVMVPNSNFKPRPEFWSALFAGFGVKVISLTKADMSELATLRASSRLKMPDAVVLHTAITSGAAIATFDLALTKAAATHTVAVVDH